jgi:nucleoside-diphosphate-sugar epimerase
MASDKTINIAILSATSHIAKGLIYNFSNLKYYNLFLFARSPDKVKQFISKNKINTKPYIGKIEKFSNFKYDCIINCIGIGRYSTHESIFELTEKFDNLIINYLQNNKECLYINFSSGAVYGNFSSSSNKSSHCSIEVNNISPDKYLIISKLYSEAKHRASQELNIIDLRVFAYFSRFIDLDSGFLITEIINSIKNKVEFVTNPENIIRDYTNPDDLFNLILLCIKSEIVNRKSKIFNDVFDVYSKKPVSKFEILDFFSKNYNLKYKIDDNLSFINLTGNKNIYYSKYHKATEIRYMPKFTSLEAIEIETKYILTK